MVMDAGDETCRRMRRMSAIEVLGSLFSVLCFWNN